MNWGGAEWTGYGKHRIYINTSTQCAILDLEIERYKTGNIKFATLGGEKTSNRFATKILYGPGKFWYDCDTGEFAHSKDFDDYLADLLITAIETRIGK